jgi:hypothetical protein
MMAVRAMARLCRQDRARGESYLSQTLAARALADVSTLSARNPLADLNDREKQGPNSGRLGPEQ